MRLIAETPSNLGRLVGLSFHPPLRTHQGGVRGIIIIPSERSPSRSQDAGHTCSFRLSQEREDSRESALARQGQPLAQTTRPQYAKRGFYDEDG